MPKKPRDKTPAPWMLVVAVSFGVAVIIAILALTFLIERRDEFQQNVVWAILAIGIGGVAAVLPGFLDVEIPRLAKAGGALAVFVLVYTQSPAGSRVVQAIVRPPGDPKQVAETYIELVDKGDYRIVRQASADWAQERYPETLFVQLFEAERRPKGAAVKRQIAGSSAADSPAGYPAGAYQVFTWRTEFETQKNVRWIENVMVGGEKGRWKVYGYTVVPAPPGW